MKPDNQKEYVAMPKASGNEPIVDRWEQIRLEKEFLARCRAANLVARMVHECASEKSALALRRLAELDQRCALLISRLSPSPTKATYQCERLLRILIGVDQAEALANEVLAADIGTSIDALAEKLAKVIEGIGFSATEILGHQAISVAESTQTLPLLTRGGWPLQASGGDHWR